MFPKILTRFSLLIFLSTSLVSCVAPALTRQSDLAIISGRDPKGFSLIASSKAATPPGAEIFQDQVAVKPGQQDIAVCVRKCYSTGVGTVTQNDKFAFFRANLKAGGMYLVKSETKRAEGKSHWTTPQNEMHEVSYKLIDQDSQKVLGSAQGKNLPTATDMAKFILENNLQGVITANKR
jgi:hypothetical protein